MILVLRTLILVLSLHHIGVLERHGAIFFSTDKIFIGEQSVTLAFLFLGYRASYVAENYYHDFIFLDIH